MSRTQLFWLVVLVLAVLCSGVAVAYTKYESRVLFVQLLKIRGVAEKEALQWGRLQLELASRGSMDDVMRKASGPLQMRAPEAAEVVVVD